MKGKLKNFFVKNKKVAIAVVVALVAVIVGAIVLLVSCENDSGNTDGENTTTANTGENNSDTKTYTVEVKTEGGMPFEKMEIFVYEESSLENLVAAAKTDEKGMMTFEAKGDTSKYVAVLKNVPDGYKKQDYFTISGERTEIVLKTEIVKLDDMANTSFKLGSVIKDFTVTTPDGTEVTISKLMETKKAIVLNFFYLACQPCMNEFPYMQEAYAEYSEDIAIIAMTPVDKDNDAIAKLISDKGLTFYVAQCDSKWEQMLDITAYPTTVVIDRFGVMSMIHKGSVPNTEMFKGVFEYYTADNYKQILTKNIDDISTYESEAGTADNPVQILPDATDFEVALKAGEEKYFEIPKVSNMILNIEDGDAYIIYNEETFKAVNGVLKVTISAPDTYTPAKFVIGNAGDADKTFKATLGAVLGSMVNPYTMNLGEFSVDVEAGNEQGVYYTYTATESGTLIVKCLTVTEGVKYDYTLYNLNTYANRNLSADGDTSDIPTVTIEVNVGDVVQFSVGTLPNDNNKYPKGEFKFKVEHVEGEVSTGGNTNSDVDYSVKVTDDNGSPLSNVVIVIDSVELKTDATGTVTTTLKSGSYGVRVTPPLGYANPSATLTVSTDNPSITVKLTKTITEKKTYSVKVVDDTGKAIKGVTIVVGGSFGTTDGNGSISFELGEYNYSATISVPSGYTSDGTSFSFDGKTSLTIKLKKNVEETTKPDDTTVEYTVNVVDYKNKGQSGVMVMFYKGSNVVAMQETASNGAAVVKLEKGKYSVGLSGLGTKGYILSNISLTERQTSINVLVAERGKKTDNIYDIERYNVNTGATYVDIEEYDEYPGLVVFTPSKTGKYKVTVSDNATKLSYYGANTSFISDQTSNVGMSNNSYTLNVKHEDETHVIGLSGTDNCIVIIERVGDAEYTKSEIEAMLEWTNYNGCDILMKYALGFGKKLTYVDITKSTDAYKLVYNENDKYYHLGSADGPVMLVHLGAGAPYVALSDVIGYTGYGGSNFGKYIYDSSGTLVKKENYTNLLMNYMENMDENYGVYPLTKDLMYILQNGGESRGWWDQNGLNNTIYQQCRNLNKDIAWMFACCYVE